MGKNAHLSLFIVSVFILCPLCTVPTLAKYAGNAGESCLPYKTADNNSLITLRGDFNEREKSFIPAASGNSDIDDTNIIGLAAAHIQTEPTFIESARDFSGEISNGRNDLLSKSEEINYSTLSWSNPQSALACPNSVNFIDYANFANLWRTDDPTADFDSSGLVDPNDLGIFSRNWLGGLIDLINSTFARACSVLSCDKQNVLAGLESIVSIGSDQPRTQDICLASRPDIEIIDPGITRKIIWSGSDGVFATGNGNNKLYRCVNAQAAEFIEILDISTDLYGVGDNPEQTVQVVESFAALADGIWLLCTGAKDVSLPDGHIWRSTDSGSTWTLVLTLSHGYVTDFGWTGILGTNIVIGEYGQHTSDAKAPRKVYLSTNSGADWTQIYDPGAADKQHVHCCVFGGDVNTIYVSYGDRISTTNNARVVKLAYDGNSWSSMTIAPIQPVSLLYDNGYVYYGHDQHPTEGNIGRICVSENTWHDILRLETYNSDANNSDYYPYQFKQHYGDIYSLRKHNGIFIAAMRDGNVKINGGIYVSADGLHWTCAYREEGTNGFLTIFEEYSGYLWGTYGDTDHNGDADYHSFRLKVSSLCAENVEAVTVEPALTSQPTASQDDFEGSVFKWLAAGAVPHKCSVSRSNDYSLQGDYSLKIDMDWDANGGSLGQVRAGFLYNEPALDDYITVSFWIKGAPNLFTWNSKVIECHVELAGYGGTISSDNGVRGLVQLTPHWQQVTLTGKVTEITNEVDWAANGLEVWVGFKPAAGTYLDDSFDETIAYLDCFTVLYSSSKHEPGTAILGETKAPESLEYDVSGKNSLRWFVKPTIHSRDLHFGSMYLASLINTDDTWISIHWSQGSIYVVDNNSNQVSSYIGDWEGADILTFLFNNSARTLTVSDSVNYETEISLESLTHGIPAILKMCSNNDSTEIGYGMVGLLDSY